MNKFIIKIISPENISSGFLSLLVYLASQSPAAGLAAFFVIKEILQFVLKNLIKSDRVGRKIAMYLMTVGAYAWGLWFIGVFNDTRFWNLGYAAIFFAAFVLALASVVFFEEFEDAYTRHAASILNP